MSHKYAVCSVIFLSLVVLNLDNLFAVVIAASLANAVVQNELSALGALGHAGEIKLPIV